MKIDLSDGTSYVAVLRVYRDNTSAAPPRGNWRLFWENPERPGTGVNEESDVTGHPYHATMADAVAVGLRRYREKAKRADWP